MKFTKIPSDAFQKLQINAGILTTDFTPATGTIGEAGQIAGDLDGIGILKVGEPIEEGGQLLPGQAGATHGDRKSVV